MDVTLGVMQAGEKQGHVEEMKGTKRYSEFTKRFDETRRSREAPRRIRVPTLLRRQSRDFASICLDRGRAEAWGLERRLTGRVRPRLIEPRANVVCCHVLLVDWK